MTPQEKALDLLKKMDVIHYMKLGGKNLDSKGLPVSMHNSQIKQCALIAVDEIINECSNWAGGSMDNGWDTNRFDYLEEVKQEIEKL
jgi:hypothetical protein